MNNSKGRSAMKDKLHGIISLVLCFLSFMVGIVGIAKYSGINSMSYIGIILLGMTTVIYSYCCKCVCRLSNCGHFLPGKVTKMLPKRKQGKYNLIDYVGVMIPLLIIVLYPQIWLIKNAFLLVLFWLLLIAAVIEILSCVCTKCDNTRCALCKKG